MSTTNDSLQSLAASGQDNPAHQRYVPPTSVKEVQEAWKWPSKPTANQELLKVCVHTALSKGLFYSTDVKDFVANVLGVSDEQRQAGAKEVDGGAFGYDVYMARKQVENEIWEAKQIEAAKPLQLIIGEKIGKIKLQDCKILSAATVEKLSATDVTIIGSRGPQRIRTTIGYTCLIGYAKRAENQYLERKINVGLNLATQNTEPQAEDADERDLFSEDSDAARP